MSKTLIDLDEEMLARASAVLGTTTKKETVNQALALAAAASPEIRRAALIKLNELASRLDLNLVDSLEEADHTQS